MKKIAVIFSIVVAPLLYLSSCGDDFLREEQTTKYSTQHFETEEGILGLATALYGNLRGHFTHEHIYAHHLSGTDEYMNGGIDNVNMTWNSYEAGFGPEITAYSGSNTAQMHTLWDRLYNGIANANLVIANGGKISNEDVRNKCVGEAYFIRGFNHYRLFAQWGGVPVIRERLEGVLRYFPRNTDEETLNAVIEDLEEAYRLLPTDRWRGMGTITKYAAAHFLAKAYLFRASERCEPWGTATKSADLNRCIALCDEVIAACPLEDNYWDLYGHYDKPDADIESSREILLAAQFNSTDLVVPSTAGTRNYSNQYHESQFQTYATGFINRELQNIGIARNFTRLCPTEYNYSSYDNVNDARLWKSFRTVYGINNSAALTNAINIYYRDSIPGNHNVGLGDYGSIFILNKKSDSRFDGEQFGRVVGGSTGPAVGATAFQTGSAFIHPETNKWVPAATPLYQNGQYVMFSFGNNSANAQYDRGTNQYCPISKFLDGSQLASNDQGGCRDGVLARTGETYLTKAEAQVRKGEYGNAITTVNALRARAQWKAGENRELYVDGSIALKNNPNYGAHATNGASIMTTFAYSNPGYDIANGGIIGPDGKKYLHRNTYYLSTGIAQTTAASNLQIASYTVLPAEDEAILTDLGISGDYDRMLHFILNERTRELNGEWNRWEELSRTKTLVKRTKFYNTQAKPFIQDYHNLRPIPQRFINSLLNADGSNLTDKQKEALQNPGY